MKSKKKFGLLKVILAMVVVVAVVTLILERQLVADFIKGRFYTPSPEMVAIRENLNLTWEGQLVFDASQPEINNEDEFNANCLSLDDRETILGCYKGQRIYVYRIKSDELNGILELTTAHELLHAFYDRMSLGDRDKLKGLLEETYKSNQDAMKAEMELYGEGSFYEELYVRLGTEIKQLPDKLEKQYAKAFKDQDAIVDYYEKYNGVFRQLEAEFARLETEMATIREQIEAKNLEYKTRTEAINSKVYEFNNCAGSEGCFSEAEFYERKQELLNELAELSAMYEEIDELIKQYNSDVEKYNKSVMRSKELQNIVNSHVKVDSI